MNNPARIGVVALSLLGSACSSLGTIRGNLDFAGSEANSALASLQGVWTVSTSRGQRTLEFDRLANVDSVPYLLGHDESELPIFARLNLDLHRLEVRGSEFFSGADDEAIATEAIPSTLRSESPLLALLTENYFDVTSIEGGSIVGLEIRPDGKIGDIRAEVAPRVLPATWMAEQSSSVSAYDNCVASISVDAATMTALHHKRSELQLPDFPIIYDFYRAFPDDFDFLVLVPDVSPTESGENFIDGQFFPVQSLATGIGRAYDNRGTRLQGVITLPDNRGIAVEPILHEIAHNWANSFIEISQNGHWGVSNVNGVLGGSNIGGSPAPDGVASNTTPFAPLELYLMGLVDASAVPDVQLANGTTVSIDELVRKYGERNPGVKNSQKQFRMAIVLFGPGRPDELTLHRNCQDARWFSLNRDDGHPGLFNFWKATGGLARMEAARLLDPGAGHPTP